MENETAGNISLSRTFGETLSFFFTTIQTFSNYVWNVLETFERYSAIEIKNGFLIFDYQVPLQPIS